MNARVTRKSLPKRWLRYCVDGTLLLGGTKLPAFFNLRDRILYLFYGLEPSIIRVARRLLKTGDTVVDIGANVGYLSRRFASMVGRSGKVYSFEPDPAMFEFLSFNTRKFPQVERTQTALSDHNGQCQLYLHPTSAMSNSLVHAWEYGRPITVQTTTFDAWVATAKVDAIRLVKIDVEGAEPLVLRGMQKALEDSLQPSVIVEFSPANLGSHTAEKEVFDVFTESRYTVYRIDPKGGMHRVGKPTDVYALLNENGYVNLFARAGRP
jgi:FkbM family methyltransferase